MRCTLSAAVLLAAAGAVFGQATPIGPFTGEMRENMNSLPLGSAGTGVSLPIFGGDADLGAGPEGNILVDVNYGFICALECCELRAFDGTRSATSSRRAAIIDFAIPIERFGGMIGSNVFETTRPFGTAEFYDERLELIDTGDIDFGGTCGRWIWNGWEFATPVSRIIFRGPVFDEAWVMLENLEADEAEATCYADCDGSGDLDFFDFLCFQNAFAAGEPYADCDGSGGLDFFDFLCFQNEFAAGCP
jgi:hypothetical protein